MGSGFWVLGFHPSQPLKIPKGEIESGDSVVIPTFFGGRYSKFIPACRIGVCCEEPKVQPRTTTCSGSNSIWAGVFRISKGEIEPGIYLRFLPFCGRCSNSHQLADHWYCVTEEDYSKCNRVAQQLAVEVVHQFEFWASSSHHSFTTLQKSEVIEPKTRQGSHHHGEPSRVRSAASGTWIWIPQGTSIRSSSQADPDEWWSHRNNQTRFFIHPEDSLLQSSQLHHHRCCPHAHLLPHAAVHGAPAPSSHVLGLLALPPLSARLLILHRFLAPAGCCSALLLPQCATECSTPIWGSGYLLAQR